MFWLGYLWLGVFTLFIYLTEVNRVVSLLSSIFSFFIGFFVHREIVKAKNSNLEWMRENTLDYIANMLYVSVAQPDTIWWDDLTPDMQDAWRRAARVVLQMGIVSVS